MVFCHYHLNRILGFQYIHINIWYLYTEVDSWRKQNIFNKGLEFTKRCKYLLEKCSWSTPLLLPTILQNCVFVIKLCIPRIAINVEKECYFFISTSFKHKELILQPKISINDFNILWIFSYSITDFVTKTEGQRDGKSPTISQQCPYYFPHISESDTQLKPA